MRETRISRPVEPDGGDEPQATAAAEALSVDELVAGGYRLQAENDERKELIRRLHSKVAEPKA